MQPVLSTVSVSGGRGDLAARTLSATCDIFGVTPEQLCSDERGPKPHPSTVTLARWALSYVLIDRVGWSASRIGRLLDKHHTAITNGYRRASEMRENDEQFFNALVLIEEQI